MMAVAGLLSYLADAIAGAAADKGGGDHDARKRMGDALRRCRDAKSLEGTAKQIGQGPKGAARAVDLKALLPERKVDPQNLFMSLRWHSTKYLCLSLKCSATKVMTARLFYLPQRSPPQFGRFARLARAHALHRRRCRRRGHLRLRNRYHFARFVVCRHAQSASGFKRTTDPDMIKLKKLYRVGPQDSTPEKERN